MEFEPHPFSEMPTEALVNAYLQISLGKPPSWPDLTEDQKVRFLDARDRAEEYVNAVQSGQVDIEVGQEQVIEIFGDVISTYPTITNELLYAQLFEQGKMWGAHSVRVLREANSFSKDFLGAQEQLARFLLTAEVANGIRNLSMAVYIYNALVHAGKGELAFKIGQHTFSGEGIDSYTEDIEFIATMLEAEEGFDNSVVFLDRLARLKNFRKN